MSHIERQYCKLHLLIKTLSKNEKGYLKKYSKIFTSKQHSRLKIYYDILSKMNVYDKGVLQDKLIPYGGLKTFKNVKNILYQAILEDLVFLKSEKVVAWKYMMEHMKMLYLYQKGMYRECLKHFEILKKIQIKDSSSLSSFLYSKYQYIYSEQLQRISKTKNNIAEIETNYNKSLEELVVENKIIKGVYHYSIMRLDTLNLSRKDSQKSILAYKKKYIDVIPLRIESTNIKLISSHFYLLLNYFLMSKEYATCLQLAREYYLLFETEKQKDTYIHEFVNAQLYYIGIKIILKDIKDCYQIIDEHKQILEKSSFNNFNEIYSFSAWCTNSIQIMLLDNNWHELNNFMDTYEREYYSRTKSISIRFYFDIDFTFAKAFFFLKKYEKAYYYLDRIINFYSPMSKDYNNLLIATRVFYIMIYLEKKDYDSNEYYIDNLHQTLKRNKLAIEFDNYFFKEIRELNNKRDTITKSDFIKLTQNLIAKENDDRIESYIQKTDIKLWLRIQSQSF